MSGNIEARARAQCSLDLQAVQRTMADIGAAVERYWPVVACEISAGILDPNNLTLPADLPLRAAEYRKLVR